MEYDAIIIGGGPGGYATAIRLGQNGKKALLIEENKIGGECLNYGCIPSKAIIELADSIQYLKEMPGVDISVKLDLKKWQEWKWGMINKLTSGVEKLVRSYGGDIVKGHAFIMDKNTVKAGEELYTASNLVIATGSVPTRIKMMDSSLFNREILDIDHIPKSLIIIGGGYIGIELGTAFRKLGAEVTIIEMMPSILPGTDPDLTRFVDRRLSSLGIEVKVSTRVEKVEKREGYEVTLADGSVLKSEIVLLTVGREPNTKGIGLENLGINMDGKFVKTDNRKKTNIPGVYAVGDVSGQPLLAHKAFYDAKVAADNISGIDSIIDYRAMPFVIYSDPEIAITGEKTPKFGNFPLAANGRALGMNAPQGIYRVYTDENDHVRGGAFVLPRASELISEISIAIEAGLTADDIGMTIHPHPTLSEGVQESSEVLHGRALHYKSSR
ncbi:MAG: dihydrolipoyl dehydrogenase [Candidatus Thermoplasmatota archaeon]|jgi:dihydrolipoamide dehydrogenase|nr:dihydrolipoyl dehydrogenase [Candidatus Thermoplasmatota archaeon]